MAATGIARRGQRIGRRAIAQDLHSNFRASVIIALWLCLLIAGGASRYDEPQQVPVRLAALAAIAVTLWPANFEALRANRRWLYGVAAIYLLVAIQLVPIPFDWWARLPGRADYAEIARIAGASGWRPISLTPDLTLNALYALFPATAAALAALYLDHRGRRLMWLAIVLGALVSAVLGLVQIGLGGESLHLYRETSDQSAVGFFANRNHQAAYLACALPIIGALGGQELQGTRRHALVFFVLLSCATLLLIGIAATGSRSGLLLGAVGLVGGLICLRVSSGGFGRLNRRVIAIGALILAAVAALLGAIAVRIGLIERLALTDPAAESRAEMLQPLLRAAQAFFPVGSGFGSFDAVYRRFEPDSLLSTIYMNQAHNEPMQLAIEGGLAALVLLVIFLAAWVRAAARLARREGSKAIGVAAVFMTALLMLSSLVDYPLRTPLLGALFAIAIFELVRRRASTSA